MNDEEFTDEKSERVLMGTAQDIFLTLEGVKFENRCSKAFRTAYNKLSFEEQWEKTVTKNDLSFGDDIDCQTEECWFQRNLDRVNEYVCSYKNRFSEDEYCNVCINKCVNPCPTDFDLFEKFREKMREIESFRNL